MASGSRDNNFGGNKYKQSGQMDMLMALHNYTMRHLHVASIGKVKEIGVDNYKVKVEPLPLLEGESSKSILCIPSMMYVYGSEESQWVSMIDYLEVGDTVLIVYLDRSSSDAISYIREGVEVNEISSSLPLHSESYGIIIGIVNKVK